MAFKIQKIEPTGVIYADPADPDLQVRLKNTQTAKSLNGVSTTNQLTELIATDTYPVVIGGVNANDALSVRVRISGGITTVARKKAIIASVTATLTAWVDEDVLVGFNPTSVPVAVA